MIPAIQPHSFTQRTLQPWTGPHWADDPQARLLSQQPRLATGGEHAGIRLHPETIDLVGLLLTQSFGPPPAGFVRGNEPTATPAGTMSVEMEWLTSHSEELSRFRGEWLLIVGRELIAHSKDFKEIQSAVKAHGITAPFLYYVPKPEEADFLL